MNNVINVGSLFLAESDVTKDIIDAVKRKGPEEVSQVLGSVTPGVLRSLLRRHCRKLRATA